METGKFKNLFNKIAQYNNFTPSHLAWLKESPDTIIVLSLQRSNYSKKYYLNINTFIKVLFGKKYTKSAELMNDTGHIFRREPPEYESVFELENTLSDEQREKELMHLFESFLNPFCEMMLLKNRIVEEHRLGNEQFFLLPAVKEQLESL